MYDVRESEKIVIYDNKWRVNVLTGLVTGPHASGLTLINRSVRTKKEIIQKKKEKLCLNVS